MIRIVNTITDEDFEEINYLRENFFAKRIIDTIKKGGIFDDTKLS